MIWADANLKSLPPRISAMLLAYVEHGRPPDALLTAILSNDLRESVSHAKVRSGREAYILIDAVLSVVTKDAPSGCWGAPERVEAWIKRGGLGGRADPHRLREANGDD